MTDEQLKDRAVRQAAAAIAEPEDSTERTVKMAVVDALIGELKQRYANRVLREMAAKLGTLLDLPEGAFSDTEP